jgi:hypothetical protein
MSFTSDEPLVSGFDEREVPGYRPMSLLAFLTLALGLVSGIALAHPIAWFAPAITLVIGVYSLRRISEPRANLAGRRLAMLGILLAVLFGAWAPSRYYTRQRHFFEAARQFADSWLALVREGKLQEAHQLTLMHHRRQATTAGLPRFYRENEQERQALANYFRKPLIKSLVELGTKAEFVYRAGHAISPPEDGRQLVVLDYEARWQDESGPRTLPFLLSLERQDLPDSNMNIWRIEGAIDPKRSKQ